MKLNKESLEKIESVRDILIDKVSEKVENPIAITTIVSIIAGLAISMCVVGISFAFIHFTIVMALAAALSAVFFYLMNKETSDDDNE